jgi:hypothetical protein
MELGKNEDGHPQYRLVKSSDPGRDLILTTMLFDVPADED